MGDDGIAITVAESLKDKLIKSNFNVIIGETDYMYCIKNIDKDDFIILIDSTYLGLKPGTVNCYTLAQLKNSQHYYKPLCPHSFSLLHHLMNSSPLKGIIIGIEGCRFEYSMEFSEEIKSSFENIRREVYDLILIKTN